MQIDEHTSDSLWLWHLFCRQFDHPHSINRIESDPPTGDELQKEKLVTLFQGGDFPHEFRVHWSTMLRLDHWQPHKVVYTSDDPEFGELAFRPLRGKGGGVERFEQIP